MLCRKVTKFVILNAAQRSEESPKTKKSEILRLRPSTSSGPCLRMTIMFSTKQT